MKRNAGFSLVELMVAMVVGLVIILGAGQLFLTVFQANRQVDTLGEKQAAVNFSVETLLRDIRRAQVSPVWDGSDQELALTVPNRGDVASSCDDVDKVYSLSDAGELQLAQACSGSSGNPQSIVSAVDPGGPNSGFDVQPGASGGVWIVYLDLIATDGSGNSDSLVFHAVNRTAAVGGGTGGTGGGGTGGGGGSGGSGDKGKTPDPNNPGFNTDGSKMYGPSCYKGKGGETYKGDDKCGEA